MEHHEHHNHNDSHGVMRRQQYTHVENIAGVRVSDPRGFALVCDTCGAVDMTLGELMGYQRRAVTTVLLDLPKVKGAVLRYARKALGLTQVALGQCLGARSETVYKWEADDEIPRDVQMAMVGLLTAVEHGLASVDILQKNAAKPAEPQPAELEVPAHGDCKAA
jgi:DNA-binding transcriptional regulator YiaG